jgi:hypothetical protein
MGQRRRKPKSDSAGTGDASAGVFQKVSTPKGRHKGYPATLINKSDSIYLKFIEIVFDTDHKKVIFIQNNRKTRFFYLYFSVYSCAAGPEPANITTTSQTGYFPHIQRTDGHINTLAGNFSVVQRSEVATVTTFAAETVISITVIVLSVRGRMPQ